MLFLVGLLVLLALFIFLLELAVFKHILQTFNDILKLICWQVVLFGQFKFFCQVLQLNLDPNSLNVVHERLVVRDVTFTSKHQVEVFPVLNYCHQKYNNLRSNDSCQARVHIPVIISLELSFNVNEC